jgi:hypothetical protein
VVRVRVPSTPSVDPGFTRPFSTTGLKHTRKNSFVSRRVAVGIGLWILTTILSGGFREARAQGLSISLDEIGYLYPESPLDTIKTDDLAWLRIGKYYRVRNFIPPDLDRDRTVEEYSVYAPLRLTFRHPSYYRFEFEETRDGAFIVLTPRDLSTPGLTIEIESTESLAEQRRDESFHAVWRKSVVTAINTQDASQQQKKGLLDISLPVQLPSAVEKIIGKGEATNIDISGRQSISFAGESRRVDPFIGVEGQTKQPLFPSLDLRQELDVRLNGQIGEKVNIQVDHSSSAVATEGNRIRLNYTGFEDDIIQLIEMGNTSLTLPGSQLVSFSGSAQGLFGIKGVAQIGPNKLTVVASKEEGEVSSATFTPRGGQIGQVEVRTINDSDFIRNTFFFLDNPDSSKYFYRPDEATIEVFESVEPWEIANDPNMTVFYGRAWVDRWGDGSDIQAALDTLAAGGTPPPSQDRPFRILQVDNDYRYVKNLSDDSVIGIELVRPVSDTRVLAVRYVNTNVQPDTIGNLPNFDVELALELIKPYGARPGDAFGYTWSYMMRHIYSLQLSNIDPASLTVEIKDLRPRLDQTVPEGSTVPWIQIFGLDLVNAVGDSLPDNRFDTNRNLIDFENGTLTFELRTPFNPSDSMVAEYTNGQFSFTGPYETFRRPEIYTEYLDEINLSPKFQIVVTAASTSRSFNINAFNITPGSETVRLDGRTLVRDQDYRIDYETGEVELQGSVLDELTPNSNIAIDYEFKPLIGGGSTSLIGFNDLLTLSDNATFGTTWLYESKASAAIRPRLGEEPTRAVVGNVNGSLQYSPRFFTSLVNKLPLVNTDARSSLSFQGEIATSFPDPNTLGTVYIDDFEGIEDSDLMTLSRRSWNPASLPVNPNETDSSLAAKRLPVFWYNVEPERNGQKTGVTRRDLNPTLDERESTLIQTLDVEFDTLSTDSSYWGGVMAGFRGGGLDLTQGQFLDVWVNDFRGDDFLSRGGTIHIDLGSIDENFYRPDLPQQFNTEDPNLDGFAAITEDTGLDGVPSGEPGDDPKDDWNLNRLPVGDPNGRFLSINGTEGNGIFDSEDMDGTGNGEWINSYFSFSIDLASEPIIDVRKSFPNHARLNEPPHANDSWRLYRIPLSNHQEVAEDFTPSFQQIKHIRIWMDNVSEVVDPQVRRIQLAELKVVGNRWERDAIRAVDGKVLPPDSTQGATFSVGVISTKTDPVDYIPPYRPNQQNEIAEKEQSLLVTYDSLQAGQSFRLRKRFVGQGLDFSNYRDAHLFVHTDHMDPSLEYFFQFAADSLNYYEISVPLTATYFPVHNWMYASVALADVTQLKLAPADSVVVGQIRDIIETDRSYTVRMAGNPSLFNVRFFYAGLRNNGTQAASGDLWLNDISLGDRKRDADFAERVSGSLSMANVITVTGTFSHQGPDFRGLRTARGSGSDQTNYQISAKTNLEYFVPLLGFSVPLGVNYSRNLLLPKYTPSGDTEIRQDYLRNAYRTEQITRGFSSTLTRSGSKSWLMRYTFDKMKVNFSMSQSRSRTPSSADTSLTMSGTADYSITWGARRTVRLLKDIHFRYWLNSLNLRANATRTTSTRYRMVGGGFLRDPEFYGAGIGTSLQSTYNPFTSVTSSFRMNVARDYARPHEWMGLEIGTETNRDHAFQANFKPPRVWLIGEFQPDFNLGTTYREDGRPSVRLAGDPPGVKNVSSTRLVNVKMSFDIGKHIGKLFGAMHLGENGEEPPPAPGTQPLRQENGQVEADTTQAEGGEGKGIDKWILIRKVGGVLSRIRRISASYNQQYSSNYPRIATRPDFLYQFGMSEKSGVEVGGVPIDVPERVGVTNGLILDSGVQITKNIDLAARFNTTWTQNTFRASETRTAATNWPDLNVSWSGLEHYGPLRGVFSATSFTVGYRASTRKSGIGDRVDNVDKGRTISPALVFTWKNGLSTNVNVNLQKNTSEVRGSYNETTSMGINMEMKYAFAAGKALKIPLPFLRNKTLRSSLNTSMAVGYTRSGGKRSAFGGATLLEVPKRTTFRIAPRATYNFTSALNGGLFVDFQRSFSEATNQTVTTTRVGLDATFTF